MSAAIVQSKSAAQNTGLATVAATWNTPATAGNVLIVIVGADDYISAGNRPSGFTFSTGMGQEGFLGHYLFWKVAAGGETSVNYTIGSASPSCWITAEISGLTASPYDVSNGNLNSSAATTATTPTITPSTGDRYVIASVGGTYSAGAFTGVDTWTNSFAEQQDIFTTLGSGTRDLCSYADRSVTGDGVTGFSTGATFSGSVTPQNQTTLIIAFKVATGGTPPTVAQELPAILQALSGSVIGRVDA